MVTRLKELRNKAGYSQKKLADMISVSQQSINKYENHAVEPELSTLIKLSEVFNVSVDYLIGNSDIERLVEDISKYDLNKQESLLIDTYRRLNTNEKKSVDMIIGCYLEK